MQGKKANTLGLRTKNWTKWAIESLLRFQYLLNLLHLCKIWCLISIGWRLYRQLKSSLKKNHRWYSPVGVWFVIALVALVHSEFKWPKNWSHVLPLQYEGSKILLSLLTKSKKLFPFRSDAWKVIFQVLIIL